MSNKREKRIYLDNAATTPLKDEVREAMEPFWADTFGNPSSIHKEGEAARATLDTCRSTCASLLRALPREIVFTSGGTESNNLAIQGYIKSLEAKGHLLTDLHVITSVIEHPSVLDIFKKLEKEGVEVSYAPVTSKGVLDIKAFKELLRPTTVLVSVMYVNSEIGTIQPIKEVAKALRHYKKHNKTDRDIVLHSDASQAILTKHIDKYELGADFLCIDAQKIYGPKGVGILFVRDGVKIEPLFKGGHQEDGLRPGTENIPLIVGMTRSLELVASHLEKTQQHLAEIKTYFLKNLREHVPDARINGSETQSVSHIVSISIPDVHHEFVAISLDERGIACATRSACLEGGGEGSHVIATLGEGAKSALRFSFGEKTSHNDIDRLMMELVAIRSLT